MENNNRLGIFAIFGVIFGFIGRVVDLADKTLKPIETAVSELDPLVQQGFEAINLALEPTMVEMRMESEINKARLEVAKATNKAEVSKILEGLE